MLIMTVTGYCDQTGAPPFEGMTASGVQANEITMACPTWMEFGTVIMVDDQIFVCMDRGPAIEGLRLDRWFPTCGEAMEWGVQEKTVIIVR